MHPEEIVTLLSLVGDELHALGLQQPVRVLLIGGAYMLTQVHNRTTTRDVDVIVLEPVESERYRLFKQAVAQVAQRQSVNRAWLSDNIAQFLQSASVVPGGTRWLVRGKLEVYLPDAGYILTTKIVAGRERDFEDIDALLRSLQITTRGQAEKLLALYLTEQTRTHYGPDIQVTLDQVFSDEEA